MLADKITPHTSYTFIYLGVTFDKSILSRSTILVGADRAGIEDSCYGTKNEQENAQNNVIEVYIRR